MFSSRFMLFPTFKKKFGVKKISGGGGGGVKNTSLIFHFAFMLFSTLNKF